MAKVSLRIYNRDIESLIDQGHLDEAIAHCRHILQMFSKHLETYRLLGKAYLEAKRYDEAVDIFSRTLMSVPDDFVAHVGMSIIRDDQAKLDDAIWHMERAFESQPSNSAIQSELRRLFGRRDGVEPPKIRMTRGALAHMYVQGELYPQAISEIKAVLGQDANRDDMKTLLARAYFHAGQKADASDICQQLLKRYPYSFDANRIMVELLQSSDSVETTQVYRHRVNELDPYATFTQGSVFRSNEVSDAAISLERYEYTGAEVDQSTWSQAGIGANQLASNAEPSWLKEEFPAPSAGSASFEKSPAVANKEEDIPAILPDAGCTEASAAPEQPVSFDADSGPEAELAPSDMPDWLKAMAPEEPEASTPITPSDDSPDWLSGLGAAAAVTTAAAQPVREPAPSDDIPDWLSHLDDTGAAMSAASSDSDLSDLPDWLKPEPETPSKPTPAPVQPAAPAASLDSLGTSSKEQDDAMAWLEGLASKHGAKPEELVTDPNARTEKAPEWVNQARELGESQFVSVPAPVEPAAPAASLDTLGTSSQEQDDAMAWLEGLASKHGAKPEELVTDPNARTEKAPEWVNQARELGESQPVAAAPVEPIAPVAPAASLDTLGTSSKEQDDAMAWLEGLATKHGAKPEELVTDPTARMERPPEWVTQARELGEAQSVAAAPEPATPTPATPSADETGMWLRDLGEKDVTGEDLFAAEPASQFSDSASDVANWLNSLDEAETNSAPPAPSEQPAAAEASALPDWLQGLDKSETTPATRIRTDELPAWLQSEPEPPAQPEPTMPTDWHPVEAAVPDPTPGIRYSPPIEPEPEPTPAILYSPALEPEPVAEVKPEPVPAPEPVRYIPEPEPTFESELRPVEIDFKPEPARPVSSRPAPAPVKKAPTRASKPGESARPVITRRQTGMLTPLIDPALSTAQIEMNRGDIPAALEHYSRLIKKGKWLEEIVRDLRDALYRYPVEVIIWQTLGDAYMRENRLQEALDAYTKAEELLR